MLCIKERDFVLDGRTVVTLGKFDGVHRGHVKLIDTARRLAITNNMRLAVFTFRVAEGLSYPYMDSRHITTFGERERIFEELGADILIEFPFDDGIADMEPLVFIEKIIKEKLNAAYVVVGSDWRFGKDGEGGSGLLKASGKLYGYEAVIMEKELHDGREIGSTWIREEIEKGNMENASLLLGHPYTVCGPVVHGNELGRLMGFPTVNILPGADKLLPPNGVYSSRVIMAEGEFRGITNVGIKPTVSESGVMTVETYLFDFDSDVYGQDIAVQLVHFLRPEMKFQSMEALARQLERDREYSRDFF